MISMMAVVLRDVDLEQIALGLQGRIDQAPAFFKNTPVIVDFSNVSIDFSFDFNSLFKLIRQRQLLPVAVRGIPLELGESMQQAGVPVVEQAVAPTVRRGRAGKTLIISEAISDDQQCFAQDSDLVVLASCHAGVELIADGNIHVYGALRGPAVCGAHGDTDARIFCTALETGLVSVAGHPYLLDNIPEELKNCLVQVRLSNGQVLIEPLGP